MKLNGGVKNEVCRLSVSIMFNYIGLIFMVSKIGVIMGIIINVILMKFSIKFNVNIISIIISMVLNMLLGSFVKKLWISFLLLNLWNISENIEVLIRIMNIMVVMCVVFMVIIFNCVRDNCFLKVVNNKVLFVLIFVVFVGVVNFVNIDFNIIIISNNGGISVENKFCFGFLVVDVVVVVLIFIVILFDLFDFMFIIMM